jgi:hypothetical protein
MPLRDLTHRLGRGGHHHARAAVFEKATNDLVGVSHVSALAQN